MVEVFKTNVRKRSEAKGLIALLQKHFPGSQVNFDLDDCDHVLRIEGSGLAPDKVMMLLEEKGFDCDILE